jgi:hypothetical protein
VPTVTKVFSPGDIFQGPADVFLNIKAPASAVPPVQYTNTLQLDVLGQPPDASTTGQIATVAVGAAGGAGYAVGDVLLLTQSGGANGLVVVTTVSAGAVTGVALLRPGTGYAVANGLATVHQTGSGNDAATINIVTIQAGISLGLTDGPCSCSFHPKFDEIKADQFAAPVDAAFISLASEIDLIVKETTFRNIQQYFAGLQSGTYFNLTGSPVSLTNPAADFLQIGATKSSGMNNVTTLTLVSPRRDVTGKWLYVMAYRAYLKSSVSLPVDRKKETVIKLKFGCLADTTRVAKDQVAQVVRMI